MGIFSFFISKRKRSRRWFDKGIYALEGAGFELKEGRILLLSRGMEMSKVQKVSNAVTKYCYEEALGCFEKAIELLPQFFHAHCNKRIVLCKLNRHSDALTHLQACLQDMSGFDSVWWNYMGETLLEMGRPIEEALDCYEKVIEIEPDHGHAWERKSQLLDELGRGQEAVECLKRAFVAYTVSGYKAWESEYALHYLEKALKIDSTSPLPWAMMGEVFERLRRPGEAKEHKTKALSLADKAIDVDSSDPIAWTAKGLIFQDDKKRWYKKEDIEGEAKNYLVKALKLGDQLFAPIILKAGIRSCY